MAKPLIALLKQIDLHPSLSQDAKAQIATGAQYINISGVSCHTGKLKAGDAFFCLVGEKMDGNNFAQQAVEKGAACIFTERLDLKVHGYDASASLGATSGRIRSTPTDYIMLQAPTSPLIIPVADARLAMAIASNYIFDCPSNRMRILGVTGTNGKTTTTYLVEHILKTAGKRCGLIGTLGARWPTKDGQLHSEPFGQTTPQAPDFQNMLWRMAENGVEFVVMEVSSHALALHHVAGTQFACACLTNVTQDHLDFHKSMESYWRSKRRLFEQLNESSKKNKAAIGNVDDALATEFLSVLVPNVKQFTYSYDTAHGATLGLISAEYKFDGSLLRLAGPEGEFSLNLRISGPFNAYNAMAAFLICYSQEIDTSLIINALNNFSGVPGRFEIVRSTEDGDAKKEPLVIVDYAHTPDGLENILHAARTLVPGDGKLIAIFGCGGDRDASKRPLMGKLAHKLADKVIITSDNPRSEDPPKIIADILAGISRLSDVEVEADRAQAIKTTLLNATADDVIVIAGKGHETYQILGNKTIDFDDRQHAKEALATRDSLQKHM